MHIVLPLLTILAVPQLHFQDFAGHRLGFLGRVVLADGGEDEQAFADGRDELAVDCDGGGFYALDDGWCVVSFVIFGAGGLGPFYSSCWLEAGLMGGEESQLVG